MSTRNEIHVIGAGLAGLTAAAFVAGAGLPVVVHESRNRLGGRATTDYRDGFRFDQGPHALYRGGAAERVLGELGIAPRGRVPDVAGVWVRDGRAHLAPSGRATLLRTTVVGRKGKLELARLLATLSGLRPEEHPTAPSPTGSTAPSATQVPARWWRRCWSGSRPTPTTHTS